MPNRVISYVFRGDFSNLTAGLTVGGRAVKDYSGKLNALDAQGRKMRAGLTDVADTAGKVGLAAAAGVGAVVFAAANFDKSMSAVQAATHETAGNMELLRQAALDAGKATVYSATESAGAIEELSKAGISTADILNGGLNGALNLAAAGAMDVGEAAEVAASAMTQFKLTGDEVPHIADLLAAGAGKAQGSVHDLGMALNQSGLVASQTGLSIEETTGTLAAFASAGLIGSDAGTSFKTMLQALTPNSQQAADAMKALGISAYDANGNFIGMAKFAGVLRGALSGLSVEQQNATLKTIFGSDAIRAASVLYQQGADGIQGWIDKTNDAGYAADTASTRLNNLAGDWEQLTGSIETALIGTGEDAQGPLRKTVQSLTDVTNAYNDLPGPIKNATLAALGLTAVLGGGAWFGAKVIRGVADTRQALDDLGISAGKATTKLAKIGGTAAGVLAVASAAGALADGIGRIDPANIDRALESLSLGGDPTKDIKQVVEDIGDVTSKWNAVDFGEIFTLGGLAGDTSLDKMADNINQVDQALAGMVESGHATDAAAILAKITEMAGQQGTSPERVKGQFDAYALAVKNAGAAANGATGPTTSYSASVGDAGDSAKDTAGDIDALRKSMTDQRKATLDAFDAVTQYGDALEGAKKKADKGKRGLDESTEAGRENRAALSDLAQAWNSQSDAVRNNRGKYRQARQDFIDVATAMTGNEKAAKRLADRLLEIPDSKVVTIAVEKDRAEAALDSLIAKSAKIKNKQVRIDYIVNQLNGGNRRAGGGRDGDPSTPYWSGGYTGAGGKFQPAGVVHRGEFVFSSEATSGNEAMLSNLHRQLRGYAGGGLVDAPTVYLPSSHSAGHGGTAGGAGGLIDYDRLARALAQVRPMYGDVHVTDGYGGFKRAMQQDRQRQSIGGIG